MPPLFAFYSCYRSRTGLMVSPASHRFPQHSPASPLCYPSLPLNKLSQFFLTSFHCWDHLYLYHRTCTMYHHPPFQVGYEQAALPGLRGSSQYSFFVAYLQSPCSHFPRTSLPQSSTFLSLSLCAVDTGGPAAANGQLEWRDDAVEWAYG